MKRDLDLLRRMLLHIETKATGDGNWINSWDEIGDEFSHEIITDHIKMLWESGFIEATDASSMSGSQIFPQRITMLGHDYLDSVRDPKIWKATKSGLSKVGGSAGLAVVQALAVSTMRQTLGLPQ